MDYLEQFGISLFKESALRKQSLYLKFDPLLKDSPRRPAPMAPMAPKMGSSSMQVTDTPSSQSPPEAKLLGHLDILGVLDLPVVGSPPCALSPGVPIVE